MDDTTKDQLGAVRSIMKDVRTAMFTTTADDGSLHAHPMTTQEAKFDGDAWFIAGSSSEAVRNLRRNPAVNVAYAGSSSWLSLTGTATVLEVGADADRRKKELWNTFTEAWFPGGQEDPEVVVVKVEGASAQYWDSPGRVAMTAAMLKAKVTGEPPTAGDSAAVDLEAASSGQDA